MAEVTDARLALFRRQYLQQLDNLIYPPPEVLLEPLVQEELSKRFFDDAENPYLPPLSYQKRVLKTLTDTITSSIKDPEEEEISDTLMQQIAIKSTQLSTSVFEAAQQPSIVSYYLPPSPTPSFLSIPPPSPRILISEARNLLAARGTTGLRVWDACLHLATYLCAPDRLHLIKGKHVLELGAGTGLLSLVCAGHLQAESVLATDGDEDVVASIRENARLNAVQNYSSHPNPDQAPSQKDPYTHLHAAPLDWTTASTTTLHALTATHPTTTSPKIHPIDIDTILGADLTYALDSLRPLLSCLSKLNFLHPHATILIATVIRNEDTYAAFVTASEDAGFVVTVMPFDCPPLEQQTGFFHKTTAEPAIRIVRLMRNATERTPHS